MPIRPEMTALDLVLQQAKDEGLWFEATTITESYLQTALRRLHAAVAAESSQGGGND